MQSTPSARQRPTRPRPTVSCLRSTWISVRGRKGSSLVLCQPVHVGSWMCCFVVCFSSSRPLAVPLVSVPRSCATFAPSPRSSHSVLGAPRARWPRLRAGAPARGSALPPFPPSAARASPSAALALRARPLVSPQRALRRAFLRSTASHTPFLSPPVLHHRPARLAPQREPHTPALIVTLAPPPPTTPAPHHPPHTPSALPTPVTTPHVSHSPTGPRSPRPALPRRTALSSPAPHPPTPTPPPPPPLDPHPPHHLPHPLTASLAPALSPHRPLPPPPHSPPSC